MHSAVGIAALLVSVGAPTGCGRQDARKEADPPAVVSAPTPQPSPAPNAIPGGAGWWCYRIGAGTVPLSLCFRDRTPCDDSQSSVAADVEHTACTEQREAACFTFRHATGPVIASCQGSLAACRFRLAEWRSRPEGASDFSECATFR